jgi:hypothetical protein
MKRTISSTLFVAGIATVALFVMRSVFPGREALELDVYVLVVGALAVLTAVLGAQRAIPVSTTSAVAEALEREPAEAIRPPDLERAERIVTMATSTAFDLHYRLRPILREVAEQRLGDRRGIRLDVDAEAEEALGAELWDVVQPDRSPPAKRFAPGVEPDTLRASIERLERL